jgi:DNA-binding YbaB/EbfC family protein
MNPMDLLKNLGEFQKQMAGMQDKVKTISVEGTAGGGMVKIVMNGTMEVQKVTISPEAVDPSDIAMLEDLVAAAARDANAKVKEQLASQLGPLAGGMNLGL